MTSPDDRFVPTRAAGLARLAAFAPRAGRWYATHRNTDRGEAGPATSAVLSPWLRRRLVLESEAAEAAHEAHGEGARKFVDEVLWRTYWKGHLEQHPSIWTGYRRAVAHDWDRLAVEAGLADRFADATAGRTGIPCFDDWARALVAHGWLHNHVRMWFASIWLFTLRLPWALGADFFARHLLDGDPASNTLSWRWVAGLHTRGKAYVARADNIARYTEGRYDVRGLLDEAPEPLSEPMTHPPVPLPAGDALPDGPFALLLHDDDLAPETLGLPEGRVRAIAGFSAMAGMARHGVAAPVAAFSQAALRDGLDRASAAFGCEAVALAPDAVAAWAADAGLPVVAPYAPLGPVAERLDGLPVLRHLRAWDRQYWPYARRGYFQMRQAG